MARLNIDNQQLLAEIIAFQATPDDTTIPPDLALMVQAMAHSLSHKRSLRQFRDVDDMESAGLVAGLAALRRFDSTKSHNPFGFLATVITNAINDYRTAETRADLVEAILLRDELPSSADLYEPTYDLIQRERIKHEQKLERARERRRARKARSLDAA